MNTISFEKFKTLIGEIIMHCQTIEYDLKLIYAAMKRGDVNSNIEEIEDKTWGCVLTELKRIDRSDADYFFTDEEYKLLDATRELRNHYAHKVFQEFLYANENYDSAFLNQCEWVQKDLVWLRNLSKNAQDARLKALKKYGRI